MDQEVIRQSEIKDISAKYIDPTRCLDEQLLAANKLLSYRDLQLRSIAYEEVKRTGIFNKHLKLARQQIARLLERYEEKCQELDREIEKHRPFSTGGLQPTAAVHTDERHQSEKVRRLWKAAQTYLGATCSTVYKNILNKDRSRERILKENQGDKTRPGYTLLNTIE